MRRSRSGFNMVEVLVALVLVGIVTITMVSFVNDHHQRYRVAVARSDLMRIAEAMQLAEQRSGTRVDRLSEPAGGITSGLAPYILDLPATDPWGNRFEKDTTTGKRFQLSLDRGDPYAVDVGMGRIICAGPDGEITTPLGQDPPDNDNDMVVDFRPRPWLVFAVAGALTLATADSATRAPVPPRTGTTPPAVFANVAISPEGSWFAAIKDGNTLVVAPVDETASTLRTVIPRNTDPAKGRVQTDINVTVSGDTFPVFYPNGSSLLFIAGRDLYRYDIGMDLVIPLTTGGGFGGADQASGSRVISATPRGSYYSFNAGGATYSIAISVDGKLAVNRPGDPSGIFLVSASGGDMKMLKPSVTNNGLLPVSWVGPDNLIYMTNPSTGTEKFFFKIRMDGRDEGIALHGKAVPTGISMPTVSTDGTTLIFFSSDTEGALLRTDGSGFVEETSDKLFRPFSYSSGINTTVAPVWSRDSKTVYFVARDGAILQLKAARQAQGGYIVEPLRANEQGGRGLKPMALELNRDETLFALVSSSPPGMYVLPLLGPNGARTELKTPVPSAGETPVVRWLDRQ